MTNIGNNASLPESCVKASFAFQMVLSWRNLGQWNAHYFIKLNTFFEVMAHKKYEAFFKSYLDKLLGWERWKENVDPSVFGRLWIKLLFCWGWNEILLQRELAFSAVLLLDSLTSQQDFALF